MSLTYFKRDLTPIPISGGWLDGHQIRRARKPHRCDFWRGRQNGGRCEELIDAGDLYVDGESNAEAGGYARDRYCMSCAGEEARASRDQALKAEART